MHTPFQATLESIVISEVSRLNWLETDKAYQTFSAGQGLHFLCTTQHISYQQFAITFIALLSFEKGDLSFEKIYIKLNTDHFCIYME